MTTKDTIYIAIILMLVFIIVSEPRKQQNGYVHELELEVDSLIESANEAKSKAEFFENKSDSLQNLKPKIKIKYEVIYKNIDLLPADSVVSELQGFFTEESDN